MNIKPLGALIACVAITAAQIPQTFAQGMQNQNPQMQDREMQRDSNKMKDKMEMKMERMDKNNDGLVSKAEFLQTHERKFEKMDKNSDGMLSNDELDMATTKPEAWKKNQ